MMQPDALSRSYTPVLPALRALGYRADMRPSYTGERFLIHVSRRPTVRVYKDGSWTRDDGPDGVDPMSLVEEFRLERAAEVRHHVHGNDMRGIARDVLELELGQRVGAVCDVRPAGGDAIRVEWRGHGGGLESTILERPVERARAAGVRLLEGDAA